MARQIKGFITCDSFTDNALDTVAPLYELSDIALSYSTTKQQYYSTVDPTYSLYVFKQIQTDGLSPNEVNTIVKVVKDFVAFATQNSHLVPKPQLVINFTNNFNVINQNPQLTNLTCSSFIEHAGVVGTDYLHFTVVGVECSIWLNDLSFRGFYPDYEIGIVLPFPDFEAKVRIGAEMITAILAFNLVAFSRRIEDAKGNKPTTHTRIMNIPYRLPNSTVKRDCFFGFIQYGSQGDFDYVLKMKLYEYLLSLGLTSDYIESIFPSILEINEFFITPRWDRTAIPTRVGLNGISSQVSKAFSETFDLAKFIKIYPDQEYLRLGSYNVPYDYNNVLLTISNGYYTELPVRDFKEVYSDLISVTSTHPDYARMSTKSQRFVTLLENMLVISDSETTNHMFAKMMDNENYKFTLVNRQDVWYLTFFFDGHQYYMLPRYEYMSRI